ncbi:hypothetical protein FXO37_02408 [Capsicum annuum]|nr:hypothetical protein FXO37_02408 [Capsicum annuum]
MNAPLMVELEGETDLLEDQDKMRVANVPMVSELRKLGVLRERFHRKLKQEMKSKDIEIDDLKEKLKMATLSIFVSFEDPSVGVLSASTLQWRCRINPTSYFPANPSSRVHPLVIAAHPSNPNQFTLGLNDGAVIVLEQLEIEGKWGTLPPTENGAGPSTSGAANSDQH